VRLFSSFIFGLVDWAARTGLAANRRPQMVSAGNLDV
jgi:hypothetical protein